MPIVARFINADQAVFFQTLLEEKGIPSTLLDNTSGMFGLSNTTDIATPSEYVDQATAIYIEYSKDNEERADKAEQTHVNKGFPFLAIWTLLTVAIWVVVSVLSFVLKPKFQNTSDALGFLGFMFIYAVFAGLALAWGIMIWRMIIIFIVRRFRK